MAGDNEMSRWVGEYERVRPAHVEMTRKLHGLIEDLVGQTPASVVQVESRTKGIRSFAEKIGRKRYREPMREMVDLVGVRVILHDPADLPVVGQKLEQAFVILESSPAENRAMREPDRFGYRSDHYVLQLTEARCAMDEWAQFGDMTAEVQVRTVMQHAWAAVDHKVGYKQAGLPSTIRHRLSLLSALLELADAEFERVLAESRTRTTEHSHLVSDGRLDATIDALSLAGFVQATGLGERWAERAVALQYRAPAKPSDDMTTLVNVARSVGHQTLGDVNDVLLDAETWGEDALRDILGTTLAGWPAEHPYAGIYAHQDRVLGLLLLVGAADGQAVAQSSLRDDVKDAVLQTIGQKPAHPDIADR